MSAATRTPTVAAPLSLGIMADPSRLPTLVAAAHGVPDLSAAGYHPVGEAAPAPIGPRPFDDLRVMLADRSIQALAVAASPRETRHVLLAACDRSLPCWVVPPIACSLAEWVEIARRFRECGALLMIHSAWELARRALGDILSPVRVQPPFHGSLRIAAAGPALNDWRSNAQAAGGGVLACDGYCGLEWIVGLLGLPETVQAAITRCRDRADGGRRETEDAVSAILRFEGDGQVVISAAWDAGPPDSSLRLHLSRHTLEIEPTAARLVSLHPGEPSAAVAIEPLSIGASLARFGREARAATPPDEAVIAATQAHGGVAALLDCIYLSARTGQPEHPRKLLEVQRWSANS